jgi:DNA-binding winged helix-turn-helix (wHTH) protein
LCLDFDVARKNSRKVKELYRIAQTLRHFLRQFGVDQKIETRHFYPKKGFDC